jgi:glycine/D-amino acid oxidase-like deaminating enzyme
MAQPCENSAICRPVRKGSSVAEPPRLLVDSPDYHVVAHRPIPPDGLPVVGRVDAIPDLYVAVMHSGITLAPAIGRFIAEEVLTGRRDNLLLPYGPGRLLPSGEVSPAV